MLSRVVSPRRYSARSSAFCQEDICVGPSMDSLALLLVHRLAMYSAALTTVTCHYAWLVTCASGPNGCDVRHAFFLRTLPLIIRRGKCQDGREDARRCNVSLHAVIIGNRGRGSKMTVLEMTSSFASNPTWLLVRTTHRPREHALLLWRRAWCGTRLH